MRSLTIRRFTNFNIEDTLPLIKGGEPIGTISNTNRTFVMEGNVFNIYNCSYFLSIKDTIMVKPTEDEGFITVDFYKKSQTFDLYVVQNENILFVDAPTTLSKSFLSTLSNQYPERVSTHIFDFDFSILGQYQNNAKAIYFSVDDDAIDNKIFFGNGVDRDDEAVQAIDNENATYLMVEIDLRQRARTIGFSKKGAIVVYNTPNDLETFENPYLQIAYDAIDLISNRR
ncbi:hypothetical protein [Enterococcus sp.]|uniref:hypothetical protein n=1 Tax=Enterococcus sp. TaxID=35783 RepID=UPI0028A922DD|nr:hypothetical protein [Enterococcus sp.]